MHHSRLVGGIIPNFTQQSKPDNLQQWFADINIALLKHNYKLLWVTTDDIALINLNNISFKGAGSDKADYSSGSDDEFYDDTEFGKLPVFDISKEYIAAMKTLKKHEPTNILLKDIVYQDDNGISHNINEIEDISEEITDNMD